MRAPLTRWTLSSHTQRAPGGMLYFHMLAAIANVSTASSSSGQLPASQRRGHAEARSRDDPGDDLPGT